MFGVFGAPRMYGSYARFNRMCIKPFASFQHLHPNPQIREPGQKAVVHPVCYQIPCNFASSRHFCNSATFDDITYEHISDETLESLSEYLEELVETEDSLVDADVLYSSGVLTLNLGEVGTYVINKQSPNKQIWFSSPFSGPKRYDYIDGVWIYKHDGISLHDCLSDELSEVFKRKIDLSLLSYGSREN
ncbi:frataxin, mitochondrial-like isoform X1 [Macrobrachium nipponense]|uniref:frataxin, mitochondrial-like isoform X1 n=2 Tax=Macrobrachium nipponense TaxID=159736 RepID=UPI0030C83E8B